MASALQLPASLRGFLHKKLREGLAGAVADQTLDTLLSDLAACKPAEVDAKAWVHEQTLTALNAVRKDRALGESLATGDISLVDAAARNRVYREAAESMYTVINGHHRTLRETSEVATSHMAGDGVGSAIQGRERSTSAREEEGEEEVGSARGALDVGQDVNEAVEDAWKQVTSDADALEAYAAAATQIGSRAWVKQGINWMAEHARDFFLGDDGGGAYRLARKEASRLSHAQRGGPLMEAEEAAIREAVARAAPPTPSVRLLDVGACGTLFDGSEGIDATAIDLCPQEGNDRVLQADFLQLEVGEAGSEMQIEPSERHAGGALRRLPAGAYDALALSLVLSYLPTPRLRGAMIRQARMLLPTPPPPEIPSVGSAPHAACRSTRRRRGLLLVVDTFSVDKKSASRTSEYLSNWIEEIEREGFVFLRHQALTRSHALAFATAHDYDPDELPAEPPALRMRREERGKWE
jgi:25S rRNA (adenine2142-N1)-methyltransferase